MSVSEKVFWEYIRGEKLGFKFRRQQNAGRYHLDFYCAAAKVCIEIDGEQHLDQREHDTQRDAEMEELGIVTLRFPSLKIFDNSPDLEQFLNKVYELCCSRTDTRPPRWWE
jgi:very-short-patch-repair endonuclease